MFAGNARIPVIARLFMSLSSKPVSSKFCSIKSTVFTARTAVSLPEAFFNAVILSLMFPFIKNLMLFSFDWQKAADMKIDRKKTAAASGSIPFETPRAAARPSRFLC